MFAKEGCKNDVSGWDEMDWLVWVRGTSLKDRSDMVGIIIIMQIVS